MAPNTAWAVADYRGGIYIESVRPTKREAIAAFKIGPRGWRTTAKIGPTQQLRTIKVTVSAINVVADTPW